MSADTSRTAADNAAEFKALSKQGKDVRLALLAACSVEKGSRGGDRRANPNRGLGKIDAAAFGRMAGTKGDRVLRHLDAWDVFAKLAKLPPASKLRPGDAVLLGITEAQVEIWDTVSLNSKTKNPNLSQKAADIRANKAAMQEAIKADPQVRKAAVDAMVEVEDVETLSRATANAAQNRRVRRNRAAAAAGEPKTRSVQDPKPNGGDPGLQAFMSVKGLADALRALVTTFPREWADLTDEQKQDEDFVGSCVETFDRIEFALANCRLLVAGGISDDELEKLLTGEA